MRIECKDYKITALTISKYSKKCWIENRKGQRISAKFTVICKWTYGPFVRVKTNKGMYVYHENVDELIF